MLIDKQKKLISLLAQNAQGVPAAELLAALGISRRTLTNYIRQINGELGPCITASRQGYRLTDRAALAALDRDGPPLGYEARKKYILSNALLARRPLPLEALCEDFCISYATLQNDIAQLRRELRPAGLFIKCKDEALYVIGQEEARRAFSLQLFHEELEHNCFDLDQLQKMFPDIDLGRIRDIIVAVLRANHFHLDNYTLLNYVLHLAVAIHFQHGNGPRAGTPGTYRGETPPPHVLHIINEIAGGIHEAFHVDFSEAELLETSMMMSTRLVCSRREGACAPELSALLEPRLMALLERIITSVYNNYGLNLRQDDFLIRFALHLKNLVVRLEHGLALRYVQYHSIKESFPFIYVVAVSVCALVAEETGCPVCEDEIAYVALHIGVLIEEQKANYTQICAAFYSTDFRYPPQRIVQKLQQRFEGLVLLDAAEAPLPAEGVDFVLSTGIAPLGAGLPAVQVSPLLAEEDLAHIEAQIAAVQRAQRHRTYLERLEYFLRPELCFIGSSFADSTAAIETMCDAMLAHGYVRPDYKAAIYAHERIAASAYGNIAIPHPLHNEADVSVIALAITPTPIRWANNDVNVVFMLSFKEADKILFQETFNYITQLIADKATWERLLACRSYAEVLAILGQAE